MAENWTHLETISEVGRTRYKVRCPCGHEFYAFIWAWAGNGIRVCPRCKRGLKWGGGVR